MWDALKIPESPLTLSFVFSQGTAIGKCPKDRLFREYIGLELQVRQIYITVVFKRKQLGN